jgi:methylase of polypeptide subunit release factors
MQLTLSKPVQAQDAQERFVMPPSVLTRFLMQNLQVRPNAVALDLGCGCGALAIEAVRLGAARCWAIDLNPDAVYETYKAAKQDHLSRKIIPIIGSIDDIEFLIPDSVDIIVSNPPQLPQVRGTGADSTKQDMAYDGGSDGRRFVDLVIQKSARILSLSHGPTPELYLVTTSVVGFDETLRSLGQAGFQVEVVAQKEEEFRPVYLERLTAMRPENYSIHDGRCFETLYVLRACLRRRWIC